MTARDSYRSGQTKNNSDATTSERQMPWSNSHNTNLNSVLRFWMFCEARTVLKLLISLLWRIPLLIIFRQFFEGMITMFAGSSLYVHLFSWIALSLIFLLFLMLKANLVKKSPWLQMKFHHNFLSELLMLSVCPFRIFLVSVFQALACPAPGKLRLLCHYLRSNLLHRHAVIDRSALHPPYSWDNCKGLYY